MTRLWALQLFDTTAVLRCVLVQGRRANKKAVKAEYNRLSDPGYAAKMRSKEKEEVRRVVFRCCHIKVRSDLFLTFCSNWPETSSVVTGLDYY